MTLGAAIRAQLTADAGVAALAGDRIQRLKLPQLNKGDRLEPSIAFGLAGRADEDEIDGVAVKKPRWDIFCIAESPDEADALAEAVEACLMPGDAPFIGTLGGVGGVDVQHVGLMDAFDAPDPEVGWHIVQMQFEIWVATQ